MGINTTVHSQPNRLKSVTSVLATALAVGVIVGSQASACATPVFRYALERWQPYVFRLTVFHKGDLTVEQKAIYETLQKRTVIPPDGFEVKEGEAAPRPANIVSRTVDLDGKPDDETKALWEKVEDKTLPRMVLQYPAFYGVEAPARTMSLSKGAVALLLDSPARSEIARKILDGDSAVWLLLQSGDKKKDLIAEKTLRDNLKVLNEELALPEEDPNAPQDDEFAMEGDIEIKIAFSIVRASRLDAIESAYVDVLLKSDPELVAAKEPIVFPIFGRGRALCALVGEDISEENIVSICEFLVSDCSCIVKSQNPGIDTLMSVDWDSVMFGDLELDDALPPLTGLTEFVAEGELPAVEDPTPAANSAPAEPADSSVPSSSLGRNVGIAVGILALGVAIATAVVMKKKGKQAA